MSYISTPCARCGTERIYKGELEKEIETLLGKTTVTVISTVCPNDSCQKIVDQEFEDKRIKHEEKMLAHKMNAHRKHTSKV